MDSAIQSVLNFAKPLLPVIEQLAEQEALKLIGTDLPALGDARLIQVTPKVVAKLADPANGYAPFPPKRADDPSHPEHSLVNATAYYVAMEMEGEGFESDVIAGGVQALCMQSSDFAAAAGKAQAVTGGESTYVQEVGAAVIAAVSAWSAKQAEALIAKAGG